MCDHCGCSEASPRRIELARDVREANAKEARHNREHLLRLGARAVNLISSPGAGKTTLLVRTLTELAPEMSLAVIEGDQQTDNDARRIAATGVPVTQINTGTGCHLDAAQIHQALHGLELQQGSLVLIENVGNLICPVGFDLGQTADVVLLSVTEGDDKPEKYPEAFRSATAMVLSKIDLLPHVDFDREQCLRFARALNPDLPVFELSARSGAGLEPWFAWIRGLVS